MARKVRARRTFALALFVAGVGALAIACNAMTGIEEFGTRSALAEVDASDAAEDLDDASTVLVDPTPVEDADTTEDAEPPVDASLDADDGGGLLGERKHVFVTSAGYHPDAFGALPGADEKCTTLAGIAGHAGKWKAWLSDSGEAAVERVQGSGPWYTFDDQVAVATRAELTSGSGITKAINVNESGAAGLAVMVWTATGADGAIKTSCEDWTHYLSGFCFGSGCPSAVVGSSDQRGAAWTAKGGTDNCSGTAHLYCFEQ